MTIPGTSRTSRPVPSQNRGWRDWPAVGLLAIVSSDVGKRSEPDSFPAATGNQVKTDVKLSGSEGAPLGRFRHFRGLPAGTREDRAPSSAVSPPGAQEVVWLARGSPKPGARRATSPGAGRAKLQNNALAQSTVLGRARSTGVSAINRVPAFGTLKTASSVGMGIHRWGDETLSGLPGTLGLASSGGVSLAIGPSIRWSESRRHWFSGHFAPRRWDSAT